MRYTRVIYRALLIAAAAVIVAACAKDHTAEPQPEPAPDGGKALINWDVAATDHRTATRAMIGTDASAATDNDLTELSEACRVDGDHRHAIGFWVDYIVRDGEQKTAIRNVFGDKTRLAYNSAHTSVDGYEGWYYSDAAQYWALGGRYLFRAFYPDLLKNYIVDPPTNGQLMILEYNSLKYQHDLMVGHNEVYTADPYNGGNPTIYYNNGQYSEIVAVTNHQNSNNLGDFHFSQGFNLSDPVPLMLEHTLAAMRFRFTFNYDDNDELTSVYLRNTEPDMGMATNGMLMYGAYANFDQTGLLDAIHGNIYNPAYAERYKDVEGNDYDNQQDDTYRNNLTPLEVLNHDKRTFQWDVRPHTPDSPFYVWQVAETGIDGVKTDIGSRAENYRVGIPFSHTTTSTGTTEELAVAYSADRDYVRREKDTSGAVVSEKKMAATDRSYVSDVVTYENRPTQAGDTEETVVGTPVTEGNVTTTTTVVTTIANNTTYITTTERVEYTVEPKIELEPNTTDMSSDKDIGPDGTRMAAPTFADNEGWIFIIPQASDGTTEVCFTTTETGSESVTSMQMPTFTGTGYDEATREVKIYSEDQPYGNTPYNQLSAEQKRAMDKIYCHYIPGYRYTYTIVIGKTNIFLNISVEPWRERWSSTEIVF